MYTQTRRNNHIQTAGQPWRRPWVAKRTIGCKTTMIPCHSTLLAFMRTKIHDVHAQSVCWLQTNLEKVASGKEECCAPNDNLEPLLRYTPGCNEDKIYHANACRIFVDCRQTSRRLWVAKSTVVTKTTALNPCHDTLLAVMKTKFTIHTCAKYLLTADQPREGS